MLDWCTLHWQVTLAELGGETRLLARLPSSSRRISRIGTTHIHNIQVCMRTLYLFLYFLIPGTSFNTVLLVIGCMNGDAMRVH